MPHQIELPRRVLVADDEPDICRQLREALEAGGWEVHDANDGDAASKAVADLHPTVVVLDLRMPKADGLVVRKQIKEERCILGILPSASCVGAIAICAGRCTRANPYGIVRTGNRLLRSTPA